MVEVALIDPGDSDWFEIDWTDALPDGVTIISVVHSAPSPLTLVAESAISPSSFVRLTGAEHGKTYLIEGEATLSDGRVVNRQFPLRCFNG